MSTLVPDHGGVYSASRSRTMLRIFDDDACRWLDAETINCVFVYCGIWLTGDLDILDATNHVGIVEIGPVDHEGDPPLRR